MLNKLKAATVADVIFTNLFDIIGIYMLRKSVVSKF